MQVSHLSEVCRRKQEVSCPIEAYCSGRTFSIVGLGCYWRFFSKFIKARPPYSHCHKLFYLVDRRNSAQIEE